MKDVSKGIWLAGNPSRGYFNIYEKGRGTICSISSQSGQEEVADRANANLIAEAGTVHNETGLSPRELLGQRDALLAACEAGRTRIIALEKLIFAHCRKTCTMTHPLHNCGERCLLGRQTIGDSKVEKKLIAAIAKATA